MSWDELESIGQTEDIREVTQKREDLARLCLRVLGSEDGQKLLEWLREMYEFSLEECLQQAYDVISKRSGKMIDGKFVKENKSGGV